MSIFSVCSHIFYWTCCLWFFFPSPEIQEQIPLDSTRFIRHFWICIYYNVDLTSMFSVPQGKRRICVLIYWSKLRNVSSENMFYLLEGRNYDFVYCWKPLWSWKENNDLLLSRKEPIAGCTVAAAVKHLLPKKSTRVKLCAFKEIEIALIFFFLPG